MTPDDTADPLISPDEEAEAMELARDFLEQSEEYEAMADRLRERVVEFALEQPAVADRLENRRHQVIGADFYPVDMAAEDTLQPLRKGEVAVYDYQADVLLSVIIDLQESTVDRLEEYGSVQPVATPDEEEAAIDLAREYLASLDARVSPLHVSLPEDHPRHGHRILEVEFGPATDQQSGPSTAVFVDLSFREILRDTEFPMLQ